MSLIGRIVFSVGFSSAIAIYGYKKKSLSIDGAIGGVVVGLFSCFFGGYRGAFTLFMFFISSSKITKFKENIKKKIEDGHKSGGQRNAVQVFSNGFTGCLCILLFGIFTNVTLHNIVNIELFVPEIPINKDIMYWPSIFMISYIAHYACCNGDTWASEIGVASGSNSPLLMVGISEKKSLFFFSRVPKGTNGGMSLVGTIASILGGLFIGFSFAVLDSFINFKYFSMYNFLIPCFYGTFAGFIGSLVCIILILLF